MGCAAGHVNMRSGGTKRTDPGDVKWGRRAVGGDVPHGIGMRAHHLLASSLQSMGILMIPPPPPRMPHPGGQLQSHEVIRMLSCPDCPLLGIGEGGVDTFFPQRGSHTLEKEGVDGDTMWPVSWNLRGSP